GDYGAAVRRIMQIADAANRFLDAHPPWDKALTEGMRQDFCTIALNYFRQTALYLAPILPKLAERSAELLNLPPLATWRWEDAATPLPQGALVNKFQHMLKRVETAQVKAMIEASTETAPDEGEARTGSSAAKQNVYDGPEALA